MPNTIVEDNIDVLVAGAGLGGTGAAFEARFWGKDKKIVIAEKSQHRPFRRCGTGAVRDQLLHGNPLR